MKLSSLMLCAVSATALVLPSGSDASVGLPKRQSANTETDELLFSTSLPSFISRRDARDPPTLDWSSDGCSSSPDNPLGFPLVPACYRHDFGYRNYKQHSRFTDSSRLDIDDNFKSDLYYQCSTDSSGEEETCRALADVYYAAVRAFGGSNASKREEDLVQMYEEKLAVYSQLIQEARERGDLPLSDQRV